LLSHCHIICLVIPPIVELLVPSWLHCLGLDLVISIIPAITLPN
jgi:hypothetical protein